MRQILAFLLLCAALAACDTGETPVTEAPPSSTITTTTETATSPTAEDEVTTTTTLDSPLEARLAWLAGVFETGELSESEYSSTFTADFIENVPYDDFVAVVEQLATEGTGWSVGEYEERDGTSATVLIVAGSGDAIRANIALETVVPHRIAGLLIQPAEQPTLEDPPADLEEAADRVAGMGTLEMAVFDVTEGSCEAVFEHGSGSAAPVASAFKLYVLAAVADAVGSGELEWDDEVTIIEDLKSIPTGVLQDEEEGETFSVREVAETMIAFSDNTGTDHLIDLVGRGSVEEAFSDYGMADPSLNIPLMDTMDLAALKVGPASGLATQWLDGDDEQRRAILDQISDIRPSDIPLSEFDQPILPDRIEWFATPADMCRVLTALWDKGEPLTQILTINPGLPDEEGAFETVAFKGGSEPGMTAMNWLVERPDGRIFMLAGSIVNPEEEIDQLQAVLLFGAARDLLADL